MEKSLFIVDDHNMLLKGLENYLLENTDWKVSGTFTSAAACLSALETIGLQEDFPKIIIVDVQLGKESGFELVEKITKSLPDIKCLIYSMYDTPGYILQAKESGAKGYISKVAGEDELLLALETLYQGGEYIEKRMEGVQKKFSGVDSLFSRQEKIIFEKLLQGKSNRQIAEELFISSHSVENYVSFIYDKTNVKNRAELLKKFEDN